MTTYKIFVSHKHSRASQAKNFINQLNRLAPDRFDFFASSSDIAPGENWREKVKEKIDSSDWLIALRSGGQDADMDWITHEISIFSETLGRQKDLSQRRCIIVHDAGKQILVFSHLQQFEASINGCKEFLRYLLGSGKDRLGFNTYVGDDPMELEHESGRLWEILVDKPPPQALLPKGRFYFSAEQVKILSGGEISDSVAIEMNRAAAEIHGLTLSPNIDKWTGCFSDLKNAMTKEQCDWIPLIAFLTRRMFEQKRTQKAFLLYPNNNNTIFFTPVASQIYEYESGDREYDLIYAPVETGFSQQNKSKKDLLFHLMALCFNTHWRLVNRYQERVSNYASKEKFGLVEFDDKDRETMDELWKRILIDILKINIEAKARGIVNIDRILDIFKPEEREEREGDFKEWINTTRTIKENCDSITAVQMQELLEHLESILERVLRSYSSRLAELLAR